MESGKLVKIVPKDNGWKGHNLDIFKGEIALLLNVRRFWKRCYFFDLYVNGEMAKQHIGCYEDFEFLL